MTNKTFETIGGRPLSEFSREEIAEARRQHDANGGNLAPAVAGIDPHTAEPGFYWARRRDGRPASRASDEVLTVAAWVVDFGGRCVLLPFEDDAWEPEHFAADWELVARIDPPNGRADNGNT